MRLKSRSKNLNTLTEQLCNSLKLVVFLYLLSLHMRPKLGTSRPACSEAPELAMARISKVFSKASTGTEASTQAAELFNPVKVDCLGDGFGLQARPNSRGTQKKSS